MSESRTSTDSYRLLRLIAGCSLSGMAKHILCASVAYLDRHTLEMFPALPRLARDMSRDPRTLQRCLDAELIPSGILVPLTKRRGGKRRSDGNGITTVWRLDLERLRAFQSIDSPGSLPEHDREYPDADAPIPGHADAPAPAPIPETPGNVPDKPPKIHHAINQPTTTSEGGGGCVMSPLDWELNPKAIAENERLLRVFGATSTSFIERAARAQPTEIVEALVHHARGESIGPGLVLRMLLGDVEIPHVVIQLARQRKATEANRVAELDRLRSVVSALVPERLAAVEERARANGLRDDHDEHSRLAQIEHAIRAIEREEMQVKELEECRVWWEARSPREMEAVRCALQIHTVTGIWPRLQDSARARVQAHEAVRRLRAAGLPPSGQSNQALHICNGGATLGQ